MPTDEELMQMVAGGDLSAFEKIVRRHQDRAWRIAYHYVRNHSDAEEIAQEAFLKILDASENYTPCARFTTYLYRVVANLCMDHTRKKRPHFTDSLPQQHSRSGQPDERLTEQERKSAIENALDDLTDRQRMAVVLRYYEDLSYREIASAMDATTKAVERLLARARHSLEDLLDDFSEK